MNFEECFRTWLHAAAVETMPPQVKAFSFNMFEYPETQTVKFGVELVGAGSFDPEDPDWACDEVWEPAVRRLEIPIRFSGRAWQDCLARITRLIIGCLQDDPRCHTFKHGDAVGVGFVDGELNVVWRK